MNIHFIGIGGVGMSGLAFICLEKGFQVSGSDALFTPTVDKLILHGAKIFKGHRVENISSSLDLVVYTAAIRKDNPELLRARELGIRTVNRAVFLGELMQKYNTGIAVSGTHGKTSTTSMLSTIFVNSDRNPTISVGGNLKTIGGNFRVGDDSYFITEACEYVDSFLSLNPKFAIILNIEHEHIDYFKSIDQVIHSFREFANNVAPSGKIIANGDDPNVRKALEGFSNKILFGFSEGNDCVIANISRSDFENTFSLSLNGDSLGTFTIHVIGDFNILNATAAILCAYLNDLPLEDIRASISTYRGVDRRFEKKGSYKEALVFDDYAHHPSEVKATITAASKLNKNRLIVVFQPHTFSRTLSLMDQFACSFGGADILILSDIYPSREIDTGLVHSTDLLDRVKEQLPNAYYIGDFEEVIRFLDQTVRPDDIILTMGAGDIYLLSADLVNR